MKEVKGKTVLITGGAMGMGKIWAKHFLKDGARVILWDINGTKLAETRAELEKEFSSMIKTGLIDISDSNAVNSGAKELIAGNSSIDILINNAGIVKGGEFIKSTDDELSKVIDINLKSIMWMMKAFLPSMLEKKEAHIVNISSAAGIIGTPYMASYAASKWGVIGLTESVKLELKELGFHNVRFTLLCPGYIDTGMFEGVKSPLLMNILDPVKLVGKAYKKFRRNKYLIFEPLLVKIVPVFKGILPNFMFNYMSKFLGVTGSMKNWKGH